MQAGDVLIAGLSHSSIAQRMKAGRRLRDKVPRKSLVESD